MDNYQSILNHALTLSDSDKLKLADEIYMNLANQHPITLSKEWQEEIASRVACIDSGAEELIPWHKVSAELREKIVCLKNQ